MNDRQLSLFSASSAPPSVADLAGLLAGPAQVVRTAEGARVSIVLPDGEDWRAVPLRAELRELGLDADLGTTEAGEVTVRTRFAVELVPLARSWQRGASKVPPARFTLDGPRLRWWCLAAGRRDELGYLLRLGTHDERVWPVVGSALSEAGLGATFLGVRGGGPAYRIVSARRTTRLREYVGDPPEGVPPEAWP